MSRLNPNLATTTGAQMQTLTAFVNPSEMGACVDNTCTGWRAKQRDFCATLHEQAGTGGFLEKRPNALSLTDPVAAGFCQGLMNQADTGGAISPIESRSFNNSVVTTVCSRHPEIPACACAAYDNPKQPASRVFQWMRANSDGQFHPPACWWSPCQNPQEYLVDSDHAYPGQPKCPGSVCFNRVVLGSNDPNLPVGVSRVAINQFTSCDRAGRQEGNVLDVRNPIRAVDWMPWWIGLASLGAAAIMAVVGTIAGRTAKRS